jgi:hypothetical protein
VERTRTFLYNYKILSGCYYCADSGSSFSFIDEDFSVTMKVSSSSSSSETRSSAASSISSNAEREICLRARGGRANEKGLVRDMLSDARQLVAVPYRLLRPGIFMVVVGALVGIGTVVQQMNDGWVNGKSSLLLASIER